MINSIPKIEQNNDNIFGRVTTRTNQSDYWIGGKDPVYGLVDINQVKDKIKIVTPEQARKTHNIKIIGYSIAGATVLMAGAIFFVLKGGPKGLGKSFRKLRDHLDKQIQIGKINSTEGIESTRNKVYIFAVKHLDSMLNRGEFLNNYTTFKDLTFKRFMGIGKWGAALHANITKMFERIGRQAVVNSYHSTGRMVSELGNLSKNAVHGNLKYRVCNKLMINGKEKPVLHWLADVDRLTEEISEIYEKNFGHRAFTTRYYGMKKFVNALKTNFEMKYFLSKDVFKKFIADSKIVADKQNIASSVQRGKRELTYSLADMAKNSDDKIVDILKLIDYKDTDRIKLIRALRTDIRKYSKNNMPNQELKDKILSEMESLIEGINKSLKNKTLDEKSAQGMLSGIESLKEGFINFKPGKVEELLSIYKEILPEADYKLIEKAYKRSLKSLDESIKIETEDFVNKLRDLTMGSAPTDVLTMITGIGTLGYHLMKADNNDQRASISLKYGIPALAFIGSTLYFNAKLFAGSKALFIGTMLSLLFNRAGVLADDMLKSYKKKDKISQAAVVEQKSNENPSKTV